MTKIVSACLLGINCRYDGKNSLEPRLLGLLKKGQIIPICPEQLGGLPTPREPAWIVGGEGSDVLKGEAKVIGRSGRNLTQNFLTGAEEALRLANLYGVKCAVLKSKSPSCGCGGIREPFSFEKLKSGCGVTAALLLSNGIKVVSEKDLKLV
jgi:uncharacterized protein YbbK (DUF523 family)